MLSIEFIACEKIFILVLDAIPTLVLIFSEVFNGDETFSEVVFAPSSGDAGFMFLGLGSGRCRNGF